MDELTYIQKIDEALAKWHGPTFYVLLTNIFLTTTSFSHLGFYDLDLYEGKEKEMSKQLNIGDKVTLISTDKDTKQKVTLRSKPFKFNDEYYVDIENGRGIRTRSNLNLIKSPISRTNKRKNTILSPKSRY